MRFEWETRKLKDVCQIRYGKDHKKLSDGNVPAYGSGGFMRNVSESIHDRKSVLIPRKGTLSNLFFVEPPFWTVDTLFWTDIYEQEIIPEFLYYQLKIMNLAEKNVGTAVPSLTTAVLNEIELHIPSMDTQKGIVSILKSIDNKIANNNTINDNLQQQAQAYYSERFCGINEYNLPYGWKMVSLADVVIISNKAFNPIKSPEVMLEHYSIPAFDESHFPVFELSSGIKSNKYIVDKFCFMISKLNPTTKRVWKPYCISDNAVCSTEFIVYKAKNANMTDFLYSLIDSTPFSDYMCSHVTGSTGSRQRTTPSDTLQYRFALPSQKEMDEFSNIVRPMYEQIRINAIESARLKHLRNSLLPKLMSGEIDVSDIQI